MTHSWPCFTWECIAGGLEKEEIKIREIRCSNPCNEGPNQNDGIGN